MRDAGWHPASWRAVNHGETLFDGRFWAQQARAAESVGLDVLTFDDGFGGPATEGSGDAEDVPGRLDAQMVANFVAPLTRTIGLIPVITTTHTEPFHTATALQTLDYASHGRAGWQVRVSPSLEENALLSRREGAYFMRGEATRADLFDEAADVVEVVRRLWDSWEDDAIIREVSTNRFIDRDRIHGARFHGRFFDVEGASITPRSPQGQPVVTALTRGLAALRFAAKSADIVFTTPTSSTHARQVLDAAHNASSAVPRKHRLRVWADIAVLLEGSQEAAERALSELNELDGKAWEPDAQVLVGTPEDLLTRIGKLTELGFDGIRLRPARATIDIERLAGIGLGTATSETRTLRDRVRLPPAVNRHKGDL